MQLHGSFLKGAAWQWWCRVVVHYVIGSRGVGLCSLWRWWGMCRCNRNITLRQLVLDVPLRFGRFEREALVARCISVDKKKSNKASADSKNLHSCFVTIMVRLIQAEVCKDVLYERETWFLHRKAYDGLNTRHDQLFLCTSFLRKQPTNHPLSQRTVLERTGCATNEIAIDRRRLAFVGPLQQVGEQRLSKRFLCEELRRSGVANLKPGKQNNRGAECL